MRKTEVPVLQHGFPLHQGLHLQVLPKYPQHNDRLYLMVFRVAVASTPTLVSLLLNGRAGHCLPVHSADLAKPSSKTPGFDRSMRLGPHKPRRGLYLVAVLMLRAGLLRHTSGLPAPFGSCVERIELHLPRP